MIQASASCRGPEVPGEVLAGASLMLTAGVAFRPLHDPAEWHRVWNGAARTCRALAAHDARHQALIDSISLPRDHRRPYEAKQMDSSG